MQYTIKRWLNIKSFRLYDKKSTKALIRFTVLKTDKKNENRRKTDETYKIERKRKKNGRKHIKTDINL